MAENQVVDRAMEMKAEGVAAKIIGKFVMENTKDKGDAIRIFNELYSKNKEKA